jgi:hypothetical protein
MFVAWPPIRSIVPWMNTAWVIATPILRIFSSSERVWPAIRMSSNSSNILLDRSAVRFIASRQLLGIALGAVIFPEFLQNRSRIAPESYLNSFS